MNNIHRLIKKANMLTRGIIKHAGFKIKELVKTSTETFYMQYIVDYPAIHYSILYG